MSFELFLFDLETDLYSLWKTKEVRISRQIDFFGKNFVSENG